MMYYEIRPLSDQLYFIRWFPTPAENRRPESQYVWEIADILRKAEQPLYFLSDLRLGRITNVSILQQLAKVINHSKYGGSTAFSESLMSELFVGVFSRFADPGEAEHAFYKTLDQALGYLERIKPGITAEINWETVVKTLTV
ncbi:MAG: hypothetical protein OHK0023_05110 [Anaerolineae bacterium]